MPSEFYWILGIVLGIVAIAILRSVVIRRTIANADRAYQLGNFAYAISLNRRLRRFSFLFLLPWFRHRLQFISWHSIGISLQQLGEFSEAMKPLEKACHLLKRGVKTEPHIKFHAKMALLGSHAILGNDESATSIWDEIKRDLDQTADNDLPACFESLVANSLDLTSHGDTDWSERCLLHLHELANSAALDENGWLSRCRVALAHSYIVKTDYESARQWIDRVCGDFSQPIVRDIAADVWNAKALLCVADEDFNGYVDAKQRVHAALREAQVAPMDIALAEMSLSDAQCINGAYRASLHTGRSALNSIQAIHTAEHPSVLKARIQLVLKLLNCGLHKEAWPILQWADQRSDALQASDMLAWHFSRLLHAICLADLYQFDEAIDLITATLDQSRDCFWFRKSKLCRVGTIDGADLLECREE